MTEHDVDRALRALRRDIAGLIIASAVTIVVAILFVMGGIHDPLAMRPTENPVATSESAPR